MKLLNQSLLYLSVSMLGIIAIWSIFLYFNMFKEIKSSIDEGLENYKRLIIENAKKDTTILTKEYFDESFFTVKQIDKELAYTIKDHYLDTVMYMQDADDETPEVEPIRMLTTAFALDNKYYELRVANSMVEENDLIKELLYDMVWLFLSLAIGILLINNIILKKLWKPFYEFLQQLKDFKLDKNQIIPSTNTNTKEFTDLESVVQSLLQYTIRAYEHQKQFIGNAAHELQTPLAIVINKLELLIENENLHNYQAESIAEVMSIINRMVRMNKSLLLLSKIENKQFLNNQVISINEIVHKNVKEVEDLADFKGITISFNEMDNMLVEMDNSLANIILSNLLKNAIIHNVSNGEIKIEISTKTMTIKNTGSSVKLDEGQIFNRFYKSNSQSTGTGLGLAIVKAINNLYGSDLTYSFDNGYHSFRITFPQ